MVLKYSDLSLIASSAAFPFIITSNNLINKKILKKF